MNERPGQLLSRFFRRQQIPNILTVSRLILILPILWAISAERYGLALFLFLVAAATDFLDGSLARAYGWISRFGAFVDPLADKLAVNLVALALTLQQHFPLWLFLIMVGRDLVIGGAIFLYRVLVGPLDFFAHYLGKVYTLLALLALSLALFPLTDVSGSVREALPFQSIVDVCYVVLAAFAVLSCGLYLRIGLRRRRETASGDPQAPPASEKTPLDVH